MAGLAAALGQPVRSAAADEFWDPQFGAAGFEGTSVYALAVLRDETYFGGIFTGLGGIQSTNLVKWDGSNWSSVAPIVGGLYAGIGVMTASADSLYVAGNFTNAGGVPATNIACWNRTNWSALGSGILEDVFALASEGHKLYVGGVFVAAGGVVATNVASWDGHVWHSLGPGVGGPVFAISVDSDSVYVGGRFTNAGPVAVTNIARWDGTNWHALGNGLRNINGYTVENGTVRSLAYHRGYLYAGGSFRLAGSVQAVNIARWDGTNWHDLGGAANAVHAFVSNGPDLYAGGSFLTIGGVSARTIAKWDGSQWSPLGSGMWGGGPLALGSTGSEVFAGGSFTGAGGTTSKRVALWHTPHALSSQKLENEVLLCWPATGTNFVLEAASDLGEGNWQGVPGTPTIVNEQCVVTLAPVPGNQFFRLRRK